jgi:hypothetical protein
LQVRLLQAALTNFLFSNRVRILSRKRIWLARSIAIAADVLQITIFPLFSEGFVSPFDVALDISMAILMTLICGWHIAFLPTAIAEIVPFVDLVPTWTIAVLIVTRKGSVASPELPN